MLGADASTKFSPWLAQGSLSIKAVYDAVVNYKVQNQSTDHLISELFWRDFFIYFAKDKKSSLFYEYGASGKGVHEWLVDQDVITRWREGKTGIPLIDACMRELSYSGWLSNRGR